MPFDHNHHYHPLLLRQVPRGARTALDVGCGTGLFARRLAAAGLEVTGIDADRRVIDTARALGEQDYRHDDITTAELGRYDFISCLASLHHVPFATVTKLRQALTPGGVLVVLGVARPGAPRDFAHWWLAAPPLNLAARLAVAAGDRLNGGAGSEPRPPVRMDFPAMTAVRRESAALLPGRTVRPLVFWRYLIVYRA
ncbi:methyltransferase domain-containing protein [Amycolatopsis acidicola]|uniref:Methyltransferase domain-containing protein n=1 Tax=Amycolatopsis acidicola TaxID=2596893 RepID=A0A5N0UZG4_9PSEU|nr:methyltransferase domain-containing protein [Amycolatopsis acidicola]KAA9158569.1 methyltransferase domain-containing protein [Amycolatopsis acidicola]